MAVSRNKDLRLEKGSATIAKILKVSKRLFSEKGYENTSTEEILKEAEISRGSLYHHFSGKKGIFLRVFETVQSNVAQEVNGSIEGIDDPWEKLVVATNAYLEACIKPDNQRIILIDAPSILGWDAWRQVDEQNSIKILKKILIELMYEGVIEPMPIDALCRYFAGATNESILWIVQSKDSQRAIKDTKLIVNRIFNLLKRNNQQ